MICDFIGEPKFSSIPDVWTLPGRFLTASDASDSPNFRTELKKLEANMAALEEKQAFLDHEQELLDKEENLSKRTQKLKDFEKEVEEAEMMLDKRQNLVRQRSMTVEQLNHDLLTMKSELEERLTNIEQDEGVSDTVTHDNDQAPQQPLSPTASSNARHNWQVARRHLVDKVKLLEATVQRYRTQVASSTATITAKEMAIDRLVKENSSLREELDEKTKRIKKLESRLSLTIEDKSRSDKELNMLLEELQNIDLSTPQTILSQSEKQSHSSKLRPFKKQASSFSFFDQNGTSSKFSSSKPKRALSDKDIPDNKVTHIERDFHSDDCQYGRDITNGVFYDKESEHGRKNNAHKTLGTRIQREDRFDEAGSKACIVM
ncbi:hypothetical protein DPMN_102097 [Dreissena polymorpha]|uniref:Uncharacterized protein n=1 Tax=Dreissena polymorpha TaxID=45954 RepID=A0A9D4LL00_DREPO|nr:hypothetical protein DPMN_102097 [Dreissena polymorpha]